MTVTIRAAFLRRKVGLPWLEARRTNMTAWMKEHGTHRYPAAACYRCEALIGRARVYRCDFLSSGPRMAFCVPCALDLAALERWYRTDPKSPGYCRSTLN